MGPLLMSATTPATEPLTDSHISWMAAALTISASPSVLMFSYLTDRFGRKKCILLLSVFSAVSENTPISANEKWPSGQNQTEDPLPDGLDF